MKKMKSHIYMVFRTVLFFLFKQNGKVDIGFQPSLFGINITTSPIGMIEPGADKCQKIYTSGNITE